MKTKYYYLLLITVLFINIVGLFMIYSASNVSALFKYNDSLYYFKRQTIFSILGFIIFYLMNKIDLNLLKQKTTYIFFISMILLILVLIPGIGSIRGGARSWIGFGIFSIQPAEFVKISLTLLICRYLSKNDQDLKGIKYKENKYNNFYGVYYGESAIKIKREALKFGYQPLEIDGIKKVIDGITNIKELNKKLLIN